MFEVGVARTFHALHQLETEEAHAAHEHSHDYRVEVVVRGPRLDENGMLLDLDRLGEALAGCLAELDTTDLDALAAFAGRPTTVEVVADHVWQHVVEGVRDVTGLERMRVSVFESPDAWAAVDRPLGDPWPARP